MNRRIDNSVLRPLSLFAGAGLVLTLVILLMVTGCSNMITELTERQSGGTDGGISGTLTALTPSNTITLITTNGTSDGTIDGTAVDSDSDGIVDGVDLDGNTSTLEVPLTGTGTTGVYSADIDGDGTVDFYVFVYDDGTGTMNTEEGGSGTDVKVVVDGSGTPTGFDTTGDGIADIEEINIAAIPGVTAPAGGETPVTAIAETDQYTGTVSWDPADDPFDYGTVYTATITLTPKSGYTLSGVTANFFTVAGADTVTHNADSGEVTAVFPADFAYALGDTGPAGGLIFYIDEADEHVWTYLEAAPQSTEWTAEWGDEGTYIDGYSSDLRFIGGGQAATDLIVTHMEGNSIAGTAAQLCAALSVNSYDDWFLPSRDELVAMWENLKNTNIGGFTDEYYWASSEINNNYAAIVSFDNALNGWWTQSMKETARPVRAARAF